MNGIPRAAVGLAMILAGGLMPASAEAELVEPRDKLWEPQWRRFHTAEYVLVPAALAGAFALRFALPTGSEPNWRGGILFDDELHENGTIDDDRSRQTWNTVGNMAFYGSMLWSLTEPAVVGLVHDWDTANQVFWISLQSYAVYATSLYTIQVFVRRERPVSAELCSDEDRRVGKVYEGYDVTCGSQEEVRSFFGGHVGTMATATSLTCMHHAHMPIYGGGVPDAIPCGIGIAAIGVTLASRTVGGQHYFSDNLIGIGVGALAGGLVPWALHYGWDPRPADERARNGATRASGGPRILAGSVLPSDDGGLRLEVMGLF